MRELQKALDMIHKARITKLNTKKPKPEGDFVLYWMVANRRSSWNYSLDLALEYCREFNKPLLVLEALRVGYQWASDRIHQFIVDGMRVNQQRFAESRITYYPYLEPEEDEGKGLVEALAERACVVVTDDFPCFFLPRMLKAVANRLDCRMEMVDSNGLYPMRLAEKTYLRAVDFRRHLQKVVDPHLEEFPCSDPLSDQELPRLDSLPKQITERWKPTDLEIFRPSDYDIDHQVKVLNCSGGEARAQELLEDFLGNKLSLYAEDRNHPQKDGTSGFSPYLHFGHLSAHQIFKGICEAENWSAGKLSLKVKGQREGWWGMSEDAEGFMDQLLTWRELGYNMTHREENYDQWESLPDWARKTLLEHAEDPREYVYSLEEFERAQTHDSLWNAAQNQLRREGQIHNYLRMLWGKKILHWTEHPKHALSIALHLNNKYGIDGRNPNSYSGVFWIFGRYDRAWGPEREIFGKIRYMTCDSTRRKYQVNEYVERFS